MFRLYFRVNNNWQTNYALITKSNENSSQTTKKQRDTGETARDSLAYSCLLKNELLGDGIEDVKTVADDRNENVSSSAKRRLFKYQSPTKQVCGTFFHIDLLLLFFLANICTFCLLIYSTKSHMSAQI